MTASDEPKICGICGQDCSDRPRTRDKGGRYFCSACYDAAAARKRSQGTDAPLLADTHDVDATVLAALLDDTSVPDVTPAAKAEACPRCGKAYEAGSTVCPRCGRPAKPAAPAETPAAFSLPSPQTPAWHIPTWVILGVPLVFILAIVFAAMPRKRRVPITPPPLATADGTASAPKIPPPDLESTASFANASIGFDYPGNWIIDTDYPGFDRDAYIVVDAGPDAQLILRVIETGHTVEQELESSLTSLRDFGAGYEDRGKLNTYGELEGAGRTVRTYLGDVPVRYRIFLTRLGLNTMLEVHEVCPEPGLATAEPGFELIAQSLEAK